MANSTATFCNAIFGGGSKLIPHAHTREFQYRSEMHRTIVCSSGPVNQLIFQQRFLNLEVQLLQKKFGIIK